MPIFRSVILSDREWLHNLMCKSGTKNADFSFIHLYAWGPFYGVEISTDFPLPVISSIDKGERVYAVPYFDKGTIDMLLHEYPELTLQSLSPDDVRKTEEQYPGLFEFTPQTELFDYVYSAEKLATLTGKKLHAKRNYINRFEADNNWDFKPVNEANIEDCRMLDRLWSSERTAEGEAEVIDKALNEFTELRLDGGVLYVEGQPIAFTLGERVCCDTFIVHFEKAVTDIEGAYPMINREFVRHILIKYPEVKYINREEDMGLENLRKAKRSYYPDLMVEKYQAKAKRQETA
jgi:hypothetical protein